jgi:hypothetical protein
MSSSVQRLIWGIRVTPKDAKLPASRKVPAGKKKPPLWETAAAGFVWVETQDLRRPEALCNAGLGRQASHDNKGQTLLHGLA